MTSGLSRSEFRAYVYALWSRQVVADFREFYAEWKPENRPQPGGEGDKFQREREVLQQILLRAVADATLTNRADVAFSPGDEAIFINPRAREEITGLDQDEARRYFAPSKPLGDRFARAAARREPISLASLLPVDQEFLREHLGVTAKDVLHVGQVVVKNAGGLTWCQRSSNFPPG